MVSASTLHVSLKPRFHGLSSLTASSQPCRKKSNDSDAGQASPAAWGPVEWQHDHSQGGRLGHSGPCGVLWAPRGRVRHVLVCWLQRQLLGGLPIHHPRRQRYFLAIWGEFSSQLCSIRQLGWHKHSSARLGMSWCAGFSGSFWEGYRSIIPEDTSALSRCTAGLSTII